MRIIKSDSRFRFLWDGFILALILISLFIITFQFAFQIEVSFTNSYLIYSIDVVFFLDLILHFNFSYKSKGKEIVDKSKIASKYYKSHFLIDVLSNFPFDFLIMFFYVDDNFLGVSLILTIRLLRLFRISRLIRIFKQWKYQNWINPGILRINKFLIAVLLLIHLIACIWYFIALLNGFQPNSWVAIEGLVDSPIQERYIRSLYWTITTMTTVGYGDITPSLPEEYIIVMIVMLLGASLYAFIIGNVASLFSNIDARKTIYWNNLSSITQYLNFRNVPRNITTKVRDYYEYMWENKRGLKEQSILNDLPEPLKLELLKHLAKDFLSEVPLFKYSSPMMKDVLLKHLINETYPPGVEIVKEGEVGKDIFFLSTGIAQVTRGNGNRVHCKLEGGEYFGDLSMLLNEPRTGSVVSLTYCEVFILTKEKFDTIKQSYPEFKEVLVKMSTEKSEKMAALLIDGIFI